MHKILFKFDPEFAHKLALWAIRLNFVPEYIQENTILNQNIWQCHFNHPVGLAGGFDKNGFAANGLVRMGFGFMEAGTITPKPQIGNPKPRIFRLESYQAIINRMGFPNLGMNALHDNLLKYKYFHKTPLFVNIGCNKDSDNQIDDYAQCADKLHKLADILVVNVSSPNTPGLRDKQKPEYISQILTKIRDITNKPILVKLSPDMTFAQAVETTESVIRHQGNGLILTNTTLTRHDIEHTHANESGGLSGKPLFEKSTRMVALMYAASSGKIPIIGVGGIMTPQDAVQKICAGASLVQIYSGLIYYGPKLIGDINQALIKECSDRKIDHISKLIGLDADKWR